jgi:Carboxypeptidase regulatory-like domain
VASTLLNLALLNWALSAATLQGVVVDWDTGRPLARTVLNLEALQGGQSVGRNALRADRYGAFTFAGLTPGNYLLTASRTAFATHQYGQRAWNRPGTPILIEGDKPLGVQIRLRRLASITGTVWDENQVGMPGVPVVIYTAARPVKIAARVVTDDRGVYRAGELVPGQYVVRSAAKLLDDGVSVVPTFYPDGFSLAEARLVEVDLDRSAFDINFQAAQGMLHRISGRVATPPRTSGTIELISDTGRVSAQFDESGAFSFDSVAPGVYELFAQNTLHQAAWQIVRLDRERSDLRLNPETIRPSSFLVERDGTRVDPNSVSLFARRKDLDADGPVIPFQSGRTELAPGEWEIAVSTQQDAFPAAVFPVDQPVRITPNNRADGWNRIAQPGGSLMLRVLISSHPASLNGRVISSLSDTSPLAPVFLETLDLDPADAPQIRSTRTDHLGQYRFAGLPPGRYRVFCSYDVDPSSRSSIEQARPKMITLRDSANATQDLELAH